MGDLAAGLFLSVLAVAAIVVFFGILLGGMGVVSRLLAPRAAATRARPPLREPETETVAMLAALYAWLPRMAEGEYVLRLGAEERILRIRAWSSDCGIVEDAGRCLEVRIGGEDRAPGAPSHDGPEG